MTEFALGVLATLFIGGLALVGLLAYAGIKLWRSW